MCDLTIGLAGVEVDAPCIRQQIGALAGTQGAWHCTFVCILALMRLD